MTVFYAPGCIRAKISPQLNGAFARGDTISDLMGRDPQSLIIEAEFEIVDDQSEF